GIHSALKRKRTKPNLILPVDMPFLKREFLKHLLEVALDNKATITVPRTNARLQPLCAVYRKAFLSLAEEALKQGQHKVDALFPKDSTAFIDMDSAEMKQHSFDATMFDNINSPDDYELAAKRNVPWSKANRAHE